jgi:hypothetical protein
MLYNIPGSNLMISEQKRNSVAVATLSIRQVGVLRDQG